ncbi:helix-turn-helix domain-containing protein [Leptodesmis sp.]|uniref:helix-turn-helix domain-containing protein n=1 Tax=Leptodesmis sp. TaxID=3100501 RepID=UPI0040535622
MTRSQLVREAEAYMLAHLGQPITLTDLCKILNTSKSPLNYGFQEVFGISPMAYLKQLRLRSIHKALKAADPTTTQIVDIAHQFGFWHMGRFSQAYQQCLVTSPRRH